MSTVAERISSDVSRLTRDFGEPFRYTNSASTVRTIQLIFDNAFERSTPGNLDYSGTGPAATGATSDVENMARGETLTRVDDGTVWYFMRHEPDSHGMSIIYLSADQPNGRE